MNRPVTVREMIDCLDTIQRASNQVLDVARAHVLDDSEAWQNLFRKIGSIFEEEILRNEDL